MCPNGLGVIIILYSNDTSANEGSLNVSTNAQPYQKPLKFFLISPSVGVSFSLDVRLTSSAETATFSPVKTVELYLLDN